MFHIYTSCLNRGLSSMSHCHPKTIKNSWHVPYCLKNLLQFDFGEFPHHPLETITPKILNGPISINPVEARQLVHLYLSINQETFDSGTCGQRDWNVRERHHEWSSVLDEWPVARRPRNQTWFPPPPKESFVIPPCKPTCKYLGSE
jgi:hypothetical protein